MKLNTSEKFLILALHPDKPRFLITQPALNAGFIGSILMDLSIDQMVEIKNSYIIHADKKSSGKEADRLILDKIMAASKPRKVKRWIANLSQRARKYRQLVLKDLEKNGFVKIESARFLFFKYKRIRLINKPFRTQLAMELRNAILHGKSVDHERAAILGMVQACKMHKMLSTDKSDLAIIRKKLKVLITKDSITQGVGQVISEMQAAIVGAVIASTVATSAGAH